MDVAGSAGSQETYGVSHLAELAASSKWYGDLLVFFAELFDSDSSCIGDGTFVFVGAQGGCFYNPRSDTDNADVVPTKFLNLNKLNYIELFLLIHMPVVC